MPGPIKVSEKLGSRRTSADDEKVSIETTWFIENSDDELDVRYALGQTAPPYYWDSLTQRLLYRHDHAVEQIAPEWWEGVVNYVTPDGDNNTQSVTFSFDTTGATSHITHGFSEDRYGEDPSDRFGAILETEDGIEGIEIPIPSLKFSETHPIDASVITVDFVNSLASLVGRVNRQRRRVFDARSVRFMGATGQSGENNIIPVTFNFEVSVNVRDFTVAGINVARKDGWDFLWVDTEAFEDEANHRTIRKPRAVYVDRVALEADFGQLGI